MNRVTRQQMFMEIAHVVSKRSTCFRLNVGALLVHENSIVSIGYNGPPSGEPHCMGDQCPGWNSSCHRSIHAERNALARVPDGLQYLDLYVTHSPCPHCFDEIWVSQKVDRIFFGTPFREASHLQDSLFDIEVYRVLPSGGVIEWSTGRLVDVKA